MILRMIHMPKRKKPKMPPLSVVDKLIYCFLFLIIIAISFSFSYIPELLHYFTSFTNNHVFAVTAGTSSLLLVMPTLVVSSISFCFWIVKYEEKKPIFEKKELSMENKLVISVLYLVNSINRKVQIT